METDNVFWPWLVWKILYAAFRQCSDSQSLHSTNALESPTVKWAGFQNMLEEADCDVLILLDYCVAASSTAETGNGVTELVAACGFEPWPPGVSGYSSPGVSSKNCDTAVQIHRSLRRSCRTRYFLGRNTSADSTQVISAGDFARVNCLVILEQSMLGSSRVLEFGDIE